MLKQVKYCLVLGVLICLVAGCASAPKPAKVSLNLVASNSVNPDLEGRPSPVVVQIYRIRAADAFNNARFFELYDDAEQVLGQDLVGVTEIEMSPDSNRTLSVEGMTADTRYIGVLAAYRDIDEARWRAIVETPSGEKLDFQVALDALSVVVTSDD
ncbi:MAG: type VI secretion system lipoprotein TssJ [Luminiphilus sp.]|jgi:type VI secretion system protein VasD|nr:type VI secretion system lipoprotein TssJ [Luminiphilus sp.]MDG1066581.1 type VI secretion system lipoprotein TssJ [Luminiphilus sp.]MDG2442941.1 type VI secretion system lipoprotein TssJ [Luminiphilus sp.]